MAKKKSEVVEDKKDKVTKKKGRPKGIKPIKKNEAIIQIDDTYRINVSDGKNKTIEKYIEKQRTGYGTDEEGNEYEPGDIYKEWTDMICYYTTYKAVFGQIHKMMVEDKIRKKERVSLDEFYKIYKEKLTFLERLFDNKFTDDE